MDKQYINAIRQIFAENEGKDTTPDRTGVGTLASFGHHMRYDLQEGFPAITVKSLAWNSCVAELLWFLEGSTDERRLAELTYGLPRGDLVGRKTIWTENQKNQGNELGYPNTTHSALLGPVYGGQWRYFSGISPDSGRVYCDQITEIIRQLKETPSSRRIILNAWNSAEIEYMALPPCHVMSQFSVRNGKLSCQMYQRSCDMFLGVPFNVASYALLTHILARECELEVGEFIHTLGDYHIYTNHIEQTKEMLTREPRKIPTLKIHPDFDLDLTLTGLTPLNAAKYFTLDGYDPHPAIYAPMAV